jgi:hypothetical protein
METPPTIKIGGGKSELCATVILTTAPQGVEAKERMVPAGLRRTAHNWVLGARCQRLGQGARCWVLGAGTQSAEGLVFYNSYINTV